MLARLRNRTPGSDAMRQHFRRFLANESGATVVEYGLIVAVLTLAIVGAMSQAMDAVQNNFERPAKYMDNVLADE